MDTTPRRSFLTGALAGLLSPLLLRGDRADARPRRRPRRPPTIRLVIQFPEGGVIRFDLGPVPSLSYSLRVLALGDAGGLGTGLPLTMSAGEVHAALIADAIATAAEVFGITDMTEEEVLVLGGPPPGQITHS